MDRNLKKRRPDLTAEEADQFVAFMERADGPEPGAEQARRVLEIVDISFRAGASTNIEVVDAQRRARDAEYAAAVAEDTLRRAKLDLLTALGRFPG